MSFEIELLDEDEISIPQAAPVKISLPHSPLPIPAVGDFIAYDDNRWIVVSREFKYSTKFPEINEPLSNDPIETHCKVTVRCKSH